MTSVICSVPPLSIVKLSVIMMSVVCTDSALTIVMLSVVMFSVVHIDFSISYCFAECHYDKCCLC